MKCKCPYQIITTNQYADFVDPKTGAIRDKREVLFGFEVPLLRERALFRLGYFPDPRG